MRKTALIVVSIPVLFTLSASLLSYQTGVWPGKIGAFGAVPANVARQGPACGLCHGVPPGGTTQPILYSIVPGNRVLLPGEQTTVAVGVTGGVASTLAGFVNEVTAGTLTAGTNSQLDPTGTHITHTMPTPGRQWNYGYTAPATAGLVELFGATNTVNGNAMPTGDEWAFHGFDDTATQATPVRMYVLAQGVDRAGDGCTDGFGNLAVLGAREVPSVGNGNFAMELHGATPASFSFLLMGFTPAPVPLDLGGFGIQGCFAHLAPPVPATATVLTSPGDVQRAEGTATFPVPILNSASLRGLQVYAQGAYIDPSATTIGRALPFTFTNAIRITIQ